MTALSFLILLGFVELFFSNIYLSFNNIYITEQDRVSYYNNNYLLIFISIIVFFLVLYIFYKRNKIKILHSINTDTKQYPHRNINHFLLISVISLLFLAYLNILLLSDTPPFFSGGYIDRIGYMEKTKLWSFLRPFGAIFIIVPIVLGYLKANYYYDRKSPKSLYILFALYVVYLIFIGQKFSGLMIGIFYFILPQLILIIQQKKRILTLNRIIIISFISIGFFILLIFHYSKTSIAAEMGGAIQFIFYRIFALQGHMSWGYYNICDLWTFEPQNMYHAMHNMMRAVGEPTIVKSMIERGVNFTGGFPTIVFCSFPIGINLLVLMIIFYIYTILSFFLLRSIDTIYYIFYAYIHMYFGIYFGRGSSEEILNFKVLGLFFIIYTIKILSVISPRKR